MRAVAASNMSLLDANDSQLLLPRVMVVHPIGYHFGPCSACAGVHAEDAR
jgi:hypothetical protein